MSYVELTLPVSQEEVESLGDALLTLGALAVSVEDQDAGSEHEQALFGEPTNSVDEELGAGAASSVLGWQHNWLTALFADDEAADQALLALLQNGWRQDLSEVKRLTVAKQDWVRNTQSQFGPLAIAPDLWIVPSWSEFKAPAAALCLQLDPGLAFGTGAHATTAMCLRWLLAQQWQGQSVLDYGCGSGILGIAAARLGAGSVFGVDLDPNALIATQDNAKQNQATIKTGLPNVVLGQHFDVLIANILSGPLKAMAGSLAELGKAGGQLTLSGILSRQTKELQLAYAPYVELEVFEELDGWVCLTGRWR